MPSRDRFAPFIIFALPRSRTAWLSRFLTHSGWVCRHDLVATIAKFDEIKRILESDKTGVADTGMSLGWPVIRRLFPKARFVTVRRSLEEVERSLHHCGVDPIWADLLRMDKRLDEIDRQPGTMSFDYHELDRPAQIERLFTHCLGVPWDQAWWEDMRDLNIQIDMRERFRVLQKNRDALATLKAQMTELVHDLDPA